MLYLSIASAVGLIVQTPVPHVPAMAPMAEVRVVQMPSFTLAGTTSRITSFEDELEKEAAAQLAQQEAMNKQRAARAAAQAELDAAAEKKAALAAQLEQEKIAKFEAACRMSRLKGWSRLVSHASSSASGSTLSRGR